VKPSVGDAGGAGPAPEVAQALFPTDRMPLVERYCELLATDGVIRGLIGPREVPRLWDRHLVNCALLAAALPRDASVADIGSGAGLPGLVVAMARPDLSVALVEPLLRRTTFLDEVVTELGLANVVVRRGRADALHGQETFDVVTARAVAPLERLLGWCMPLVSPRGALIAMKGESAEEEVKNARAVLRKLGCAEPSVDVLAMPASVESTTAPQTRVVRVTWADPSRVSLPTSGGRGGPRSGTGRSARHKRRPS
jgi:16S rRNA (guanine527-N7)-methyltransferase